MKKYGIPTADYKGFSNLESAVEYLNSFKEWRKIVIKADGLAAGKGVYICDSKEYAVSVVSQIMKDRIFGKAGNKIIIEEFIDGQELSYLIFTDGKSYSMMPAAQDHKKIGDGDKGLNTGGMGAYCPSPLASKELNKKVEEEIICKVTSGIIAEKLDYIGVLYAGVIVKDGEPFVLEFNCRFGDPETQSILPLLKTDLVEICVAILNNSLSKISIKWADEFSVCVVLASDGYPQYFEKGFEISGLESISKDTLVFHAGTELRDNKFVTSGGRVLSVVSTGKTLEDTVEKIYNEIKFISFKNMYYRRDIAQKAII
jgi:phosphoribosylamine--glycine ligase